MMKLRDMVERGVQAPQPKVKPSPVPRFFKALLAKGSKKIGPKVQLKKLAGNITSL